MLTRRGWALVAAIVAALAMSALFSPRALNAIVGPAVVALVAAAIQLKRTDQPELQTQVPDYGFAGDTATVELEFNASTPLTSTVRLHADDGLVVVDSDVETTVSDDAIAFDVELAERGVRNVGPIEIVAEDVFGLWKQSFRYPVTRELVVFPKIRELRDASDLAALHRDFGLSGRDRFDQLREYERGDPMRDIHWKSSAKRPGADLVVMEFEDSEERQQVELLAEADAGRADDVAEAAASVATYLLESDLAVGLTVPGGRVEPGMGKEHRNDILTLLARISAGSVRDAHRDDADVIVSGSAEVETVHVTIGERTVTFGQLSGDGASVGATGTVAGRTAVADGSGGWNPDGSGDWSGSDGSGDWSGDETK